MIDLNSIHIVSSEHTLFRAFFIVVHNRFVLPETLLSGVEWAHTAMLSGFLSAKWSSASSNLIRTTTVAAIVAFSPRSNRHVPAL